MQLSDFSEEQQIKFADRFLAYCESQQKGNEPLKVTGHHYPDVDSLVSMYFVNTLLKLFGIKSKPVISCSEKDKGKTYEELTSYSTREVMKFLGIKAEEWDIEVDPENIILVDQQPTPSYPGPIVATIDHRAPNDPEKLKDSDIVMKSSSCAYLIFSVFFREWDPRSLALKKAAVATIIDTMYLRSEKLVLSELKALKDFVDMDGLTKTLMNIAIQPPDLDDAFDNVKEYEIIERAPDSTFDIKDKERYYDPFKYTATYIELNSATLSVDDAPISEVIQKMEEADENMLFCFYDYFHNETFFIIRAKFYCMKDYITYSEKLNGIRPRGSFFKNYIETVIMPKMAMIQFNKAIDDTEEAIALQSDLVCSSEVTAMMLSTNAFSEGILTTLHIKATEKPMAQNGWNPPKVSFVEFQDKYYGLDLSGETRKIIGYDELPEGDEIH